eukprot:gene660-8161_t
MLKLKQYEKEEEEIDTVLTTLGLRRKRIPKDGSCLFRCISDYLGFVQKFNHERIRNEIIDYVELNKIFFEMFLDEDFTKYCSKLRKLEEWGGQIELEAASQLYKLHITVFSTAGICANHGEEHKKKLNLSYIHGNHYDIVYDLDYWKKLEFSQSLVYNMIENVSNKNDEESVVEITNENNLKWIYFNVEYEEWKERMHKKKKKTTNKKNKMNNTNTLKKLNNNEIIKSESIWDVSNEYVTSNKVLEENENEKIIVIPSEEEQMKKKQMEELKKKEEELKKKEEPKEEKQMHFKKNFQKREEKYDDEFSKFITKYKNKNIYQNIIVIGNFDRTIGFALKSMKNTSKLKKWFIFDIFGEIKKNYSIGKQIDIIELFKIFDRSIFSKHYLLGISKEDLNEIYHNMH